MVHPIAEERLATWRAGQPFPCHACGVGDCLPKMLRCAECFAAAEAGVVPVVRVSRKAKSEDDQPQLALF